MRKGGKTWYYDTGVFKTISNVIAYKLGSGATPWIDKYSTYFQWNVSSGQGYFCPDIPVDLTPIRQIHFIANNVNGTTVFVGVQPSNANITGLRSVNVTSSTDAEYIVDVSDLTGNYYLSGGFSGGNTTRYLQIKKMWGE